MPQTLTEEKEGGGRSVQENHKHCLHFMDVIRIYSTTLSHSM